MARYTGPRSRINRRFGITILGSSKALERRNYPPGVHGVKNRRKQSDYGAALSEKQKLRFHYGIMERQFRRYYEMALCKRGVTGENLLQFLELRLDNVVYRLGMAPSRPLARQMVNHGHIKVNGRKVTIASYICRQGDVIEVKDSPKSRQMALRSFDNPRLQSTPGWLNVLRESFKGTVVRTPALDEIPPIASTQVVVELYSK